MDVLGMRSKAGIKWEDTRRSFRAVRRALDVAMLDRACSNANFVAKGQYYTRLRAKLISAK